MTESKRGTPAQSKTKAAPSRTSVKKTPVKTAPALKNAKPKPSPCIFMPTLLPDPFGETSPELCWELRLKSIRVAVRLTQFGWNARVFGEGIQPVTEKADHLSDLRELLSAHALPKTVAAALAGPWVLAYDTAGF